MISVDVFTLYLASVDGCTLIFVDDFTLISAVLL